MSNTFGHRVIGKDAYDKAVRDEKGGAHVFGVRVTGAITGDGPVAQAKRATEHGPLVVAGAQQSDTKGNPSEGVSIEELRNILAENPTFLDSLYEAELARSEPRPDALGIIREVEKGIKGAGRQEILKEIASLLGEDEITAGQRADLNAGFVKAQEDRAAREADNLLLADADRIKALKEREDNLNAVKNSKNESTRSQLPSSAPDTLAQAKEAAGLNEPGASEGTQPKVPTKPDGPVHAESQSSGPRLLTGKDGEETTSTSTSTDDEEGSRPDIENATAAELESYIGEEEMQKLKDKGGSGADGRIVKADLVKVAKRAARSRGH